MSREMTVDEVREAFLNQVRAYIDYAEAEARWPTVRKKLEGLTFCILNILDGTTGLPRFIVAPHPHPSDREYRANQGEDWWPENHHLDDQIKADIAGGLHEEFYRKDGNS